MITYNIVTLLIILIVTITLSYSYNKEAFEDIAAKNATPAPATPAPATPALPLSNPGTMTCVPTNPSAPISMPVSTPSVINPDVSLSDTGYQAMALHKQSNLLNDIQKIVHNELLANRMTDVSVKNAPDSSMGDNSMGDRCNSNSSDSCEQEERHHDMSKYIKKNEIPCWGCSIDY